MPLRLTYLGGPTYLIEVGSFRIVTDPGFDPQGTERSEGPRAYPDQDHGSADPGGQDWDPLMPCCSATRSILTIWTTKGGGCSRRWARQSPLLRVPRWGLPGKNVQGLATWQSTELTSATGEKLKITATPAVHTSNPALRDAVGEVTGFILEWQGQETGAFYVSGDTVWIDEILEIGKRFKVASGILHLGAANVPAVGENYLTMSSAEGARAAKALGMKSVYPAHILRAGGTSRKAVGPSCASLKGRASPKHWCCFARAKRAT